MKFPITNKEKIDRKNKHSWRGVDIIGHSGFGITNMDDYINRSDFKETILKVKQSNMWKNLKSKTA